MLKIFSELSAAEAAVAGDIQALRLAIQKHPRRVNKAHTRGACALHLAAGNSSCLEDIRNAMVRELLNRGADPRLQDEDGCTALHWAARQGHGKAMKELLLRDPQLAQVRNHAGATADDLWNARLRPRLPPAGPDPPAPQGQGSGSGSGSGPGHPPAIRLQPPGRQAHSGPGTPTQGWDSPPPPRVFPPLPGQPPGFAGGGWGGGGPPAGGQAMRAPSPVTTPLAGAPPAPPPFGQAMGTPVDQRQMAQGLPYSAPPPPPQQQQQLYPSLPGGAGMYPPPDSHYPAAWPARQEPSAPPAPGAPPGQGHVDMYCASVNLLPSHSLLAASAPAAKRVPSQPLAATPQPASPLHSPYTQMPAYPSLPSQTGTGQTAPPTPAQTKTPAASPPPPQPSPWLTPPMPAAPPSPAATNSPPPSSSSGSSAHGCATVQVLPPTTQPHAGKGAYEEAGVWQPPGAYPGPAPSPAAADTHSPHSASAAMMSARDAQPAPPPPPALPSAPPSLVAPPPGVLLPGYCVTALERALRALDTDQGRRPAPPPGPPTTPGQNAGSQGGVDSQGGGGGGGRGRASPMRAFQGRRYSLQQLMAATQNFSPSAIIGEGSFAKVYRGKLDGLQVAVKKPRCRLDAEQARQFQVELSVLSAIHHPHIIPLIGSCPEEALLVYQLADRGSLQSHLFPPAAPPGPDPPGSPDPGLSWRRCLQVAQHAALGLHALHSAQPEPILHRDIKPSNILLNAHWVAMLGDVGLAKIMDMQPGGSSSWVMGQGSRAAGTVSYWAPEVLSNQISAAGDIYALGMVMLQMLTGSEVAGPLLREVVAQASQHGGAQPQAWHQRWAEAPQAASHLALLALKCTDSQPRSRPAALALAETLQQVAEAKA